MRAPTPPIVLAVALLAAGLPRTRACADTEHRRLDFVVGNWLLQDGSGAATGTVTITKEYGGCVLVEKRRGIGGERESLGIAGYRPEQRTWHRDLVDETGIVLAFDGRWEGTRMVMTGKDYSSAGGTRLHRVTWARTRDGSVDESWRTSDDAGRTWQARRDVRFRRIGE